MLEDDALGSSSSDYSAGLGAVARDLGSVVSGSEIRLEPVCPSDEDVLYETFASTRAEEMALTGWNADQQEGFLRMQYEAQRRSYLLQMPEAEYFVIRRGDAALGRLIVERRPQEIHILDIAVLPQFRSQGVGSYLMAELMKETEAAAKALTLHVERFNPALRWYERLGFTMTGSGPIYLEMAWRAGTKVQSSGDAEVIRSKPVEV